jgi:hypothetical protein
MDFWIAWFAPRFAFKDWQKKVYACWRVLARISVRYAEKAAPAWTSNKAIAVSVLLPVRYDVLCETEANIENRRQQHRGYTNQQNR